MLSIFLKRRSIQLCNFEGQHCIFVFIVTHCMMFKMSDANCWYIMRTWLPTLYKEKIYFLTEYDEISEMIILVSRIAFSFGIKINYHIWSIICHIFQGHHPLNIGKNTISLCINPKMCTHIIENINYVTTLNAKWILITIFSNRRWYLKYHCSIM